jgi:hypothetical protein
VTVDPKNKDAFERALSGCIFACVGEVTKKKNFVVASGTEIISARIADLKESYKKTLRW